MGFFGDRWILTLNRKFNIEIIDLGSLKLNVKWEKTLNQGMLSGGSAVYVHEWI